MANLISQINVSLKKIRDPIIRERLLLVRAAQKQPLREVGKTFYKSFKDFREAIIKYYRTKRFNLEVYKYLCR